MARRAPWQGYWRSRLVSARFDPNEDGFDDVARLWGLRLLAWIDSRSYAQCGSVESLEVLLDKPVNERTPIRNVVGLARKSLAKICRRKVSLAGPLRRNLDLLGDVVSLTPEEKDILAFAVVSERYEPLEELLESADKLSDQRLAKLLSTALRLDPNAVRDALLPKGRLRSSGLMTLDNGVTAFREKIALLPGLPNALLSEHEGAESLFSFCVRRAAPPSLTTTDFQSHSMVLSLLISHLRRVREDGKKGCNILLFGRPGVGKTEIARTVAQEVGCQLYEVCAPSPAENVREDRLMNYQFSQSLLARDPKALILFDEVEDVFPSGRDLFFFLGPQPASGSNKAWTNRLLEENPVPAIWVANSVHHVDPAFLRRFQIVQEIGPLPRSVRRRLLENSLAGIVLPEGLLERLSDNPEITPADTARLKEVVSAVDLSNAETLEQQLELVLTGHLKARGIRRTTLRYPRPKRFDLDLLNADTDIALLVQALRRSPSARICLYGPPGTGKTALAHHVADLLEKPIIVKRASDLLSMWVGRTEENIAEMFREAQEDGALLLLDEADSFLQDRRGAHRSWEITQVNELLTQMECFRGLFLCATNFMDSLDAAVLRRFSFKIRFDYLTRAQREKCFLRTLRDVGCSIEKLPADVTPLS